MNINEIAWRGNLNLLDFNYFVMKTIIVINDGSPAAEHAAGVALGIAQKVNANLLVANVYQPAPVKLRDYVLAGNEQEDGAEAPKSPGLISRLITMKDHLADNFVPEISFVNAADFSLNNLVHFINNHDTWMMVKGANEVIAQDAPYLSANIQSILNRVSCPLLLVPEKSQLQGIERIAYMADLRYCQIPVVNYLAQLARPYQSKIQIAHVSAKGLPDMGESYARSFFSDAICRKVSYDQLYFNNIREKDLNRVIDVLIHGMKTDLLVLINHQFHFEELMGRYITNQLPGYITVPVLVFPS